MQLMNDAFHRWKQGEVTYAIPGAESPQQAWQRASAAVDAIVEAHDPTGGDVFVCMHGRMLRILLAGLLGYGIANMHLFEHSNTCVNILRRTGARWQAEKLNCTLHLPDVTATTE